MKRVPIWLFVVIFYFVYDDVWFSSEDYPITNLVLTIFLIFVAFFFAIGQGNAFMELWNLGLEYGN
jgi:hypothetical protein